MYSLMASVVELGVDLRKRELACSRIFWIWAERLGLRGRGAGGTCDGVSRVRRERWDWLRRVSSLVRE